MVNLIASVPDIGSYVWWPKVLIMAVMVFPWLYFAPWVQKDSQRLRIPQYTWPSMVLGFGVLGFVLWIFLPIWILGMLVYILLAISPYMGYVLYRNGRVIDDSEKVLTGEWFGQVIGGSKKQTQGPQPQTQVKLYTNHSRLAPEPQPGQDPPEAIETYNLAQHFLHDLMWRRASEAEIAPVNQQQARVRFIIDGMVSERPPMAPQQAEALIQYLKPLAGMDPEERRRPQEGKIAVDAAGNPTDLLLTSAGSTGGQRLQIKVASEFLQTNIEELGLPDEMRDKVIELSAPGGGIFIISSPSRNGQTSTMYSAIKSMDAFMYELISLEKQPQLDIENVKQHRYKNPKEQSETLAAGLRRDANVVMLDEVTGAETVQLIQDSAESVSYIVGERARNTFTALAKWVQTVGDQAAAVTHLKGVLCQVLIRTLCPACKEAYKPDAQLLAKANLPANKINMFYRPPSQPKRDEEGNPIICQTCQGTGYFGRTGIFELLEINDELRQLIASGASASQIKAAARKNKMLYLQEQGLRKVISGQTSIQEVIRVTQKPKG